MKLYIRFLKWFFRERRKKILDEIFCEFSFGVHHKFRNKVSIFLDKIIGNKHGIQFEGCFLDFLVYPYDEYLTLPKKEIRAGVFIATLYMLRNIFHPQNNLIRVIAILKLLWTDWVRFSTLVKKTLKAILHILLF